MRVLVIYVSVSGNTERIAKVIAKALNAEIKRVKKPDDFSSEWVNNYDVVGFGSGIYYFKHHKLLLELVDRLPNVDRKLAFIFSTAGIPIKVINHSYLRKSLKKKGFKIIGEFTCRGFDDNGILKLVGGINKGHPNEGDLKRAEKFANNLKRSINALYLASL